MASTVGVGGGFSVNRQIAISFTIAGGASGIDFIGPFPPGSFIRAVFLSGRSTDPDGVFGVGMAPSKLVPFGDCSRFHREQTLPVGFSALIPFPLPINHVVGPEAPFFAVYYDGTNVTGSTVVVAWLDVVLKGKES